MPNYTFITDYRGGTYICQKAADDLGAAQGKRIKISSKKQPFKTKFNIFCVFNSNFSHYSQECVSCRPRKAWEALSRYLCYALRPAASDASHALRGLHDTHSWLFCKYRQKFHHF